MLQCKFVLEYSMFSYLTSSIFWSYLRSLKADKSFLLRCGNFFIPCIFQSQFLIQMVIFHHWNQIFSVYPEIIGYLRKKEKECFNGLYPRLLTSWLHFLGTFLYCESNIFGLYFNIFPWFLIAPCQDPRGSFHFECACQASLWSTWAYRTVYPFRLSLFRTQNSS